MARILSTDPLAGVRTLWHEDATDGTITVHTEHNVEDIVDAAVAQHRATDERARWGDMAKVASIPLPLFLELERTGLSRDQKAFRRWLDDPDNAAFRTRPGKLSR